MYNEKLRKITSLTLMTIMVAGGLTFAIPGVIPDVSADSKSTANLYVSTTTFGGPMIVEVIVRDPNYSQTDENEAEPDVTINGNELRLIQATDGYWYAYVAHQGNVAIVDDVGTADVGVGLDFGTICPSEQANNIIDADFDASATVYVNANTCNTTAGTINPGVINVLGNAKEPTDVFSTFVTLGNAGLNNTAFWPFIQTFDDFADDSNVEVIYNTGGNSQQINISYEDSMDDFADFSFDRDTYPHNADVHLTISDNQLNIDPTDEDIWTFATNGSNDAYYRIFSESGTSTLGDNIDNLINYEDALNEADYGDNGFLIINPSPNSDLVLLFGDNDDQNATPLYNDAVFNGTLNVDAQLVTVQETNPNSGVFSSTDNNHDSIIRTTDNEDIRDVDFIVDYNDTTVNRLVSFFLGDVELDLTSIESDWGSGEPLTVIIRDQDENKNTLREDDFNLSDDTYDQIPSVLIGNPFTLEAITDVTIQDDTNEMLRESLDTARANLSVNTGFIAGNNTSLQDIFDELDETDRTEYDSLNANRITYQDQLDEDQNALDILGDLDSPSSTALANAQAAVDSSEAMLAEVDTDIDRLFNSTQRAGIADLRAALDNLETEKTTLENEITTLIMRIADPSLDNIEESQRVFGKIFNINTGDTELPDNPIITISTGVDSSFLNEFEDEPGVHQYVNYDVRSLGDTTIRLYGINGGDETLPVMPQGLFYLNSSTFANEFAGDLRIELATSLPEGNQNGTTYNIALDVFTFGEEADGTRHNDAIYRFEAEETDVNTGVYAGTIEYVMLNQINIFDQDTYGGLETIGDELDIIVHEDLTDEDGVEVIYFDTDGQGVSTQVSDKIDALTYSGIVSFDGDNYKVADTVVITLEDRDLNTDSDVIDIYTVVTDGTSTTDTIALSDQARSLLLDVTFDDTKWTASNCPENSDIGGLGSVISSLKETGSDTGIFTTDFQIPEQYCPGVGEEPVSVTGLDLEVNYQDFRDASGETIEVGDSAGIRATTGSVSLDRTVYPVPFGQPDDGANGESNPSQFPVHATAIGDDDVTEEGHHLESGILTVHVRVNDPDYDVSGSGADQIAEDATNGPVRIMVTRGSSTVMLGTAGAEEASLGANDFITIGDNVQDNTREYGPILETAPDSGIFELDLPIEFTDGPASTQCPASNDDAVSHIMNGTSQNCILQGDILTVEYNDPTDASGDENTITDSATFDLRNGVLQTDKSVYIIGSDMILTLIEPDFDLDNDQAETFDLDLIEWDSDAATTTMGDQSGEANAAAFDPEPSNFRETGDSTGIFQIVIEIPEELGGDRLERGEEIELEYTDWGPSGADYVGHEDEDVNLTVFTSNFGATIELDQKVYTWTDKVYITVVAPDHNFDSDLVDEIGDTNEDPLKVSTRGAELDEYKLVETGTDTGIFTGEVILTGFRHDADGDSSTGDNNGNDVIDEEPRGDGPTNGFLPADDDDGLAVSFEFSDNETVVGSALIRWNIGETQWLEASYPASGSGVVRIIDPDMNLNPEAVDNFSVDVWSDSDVGGIDLTVNETNEATGIFEGVVFFTTTEESSGHRLRVAEGDTVTAEYEDNTLPNPYTTADELNVTATSIIGTTVPPLERVPATNLRAVDAFGNSLDIVSVDQQVQVSADLRNGQDREQTFAYLVQIQDGNGVTVKLDWLTGTLSSDQSFSSAVSWNPTESGTYTVTAFVWESVDNPTALSPPISTTVSVN